MLETLKYIVGLLKEAGIPLALIVYMLGFAFLFLKYLEAKYGVKIFPHKTSDDTHPQDINIIVEGQPKSIPDRRQYITPEICKSYRKETDTQLKEIRTTLNKIEGSTSMIEKIVLQSHGNG
jgi:hypothetical protein